MHLCHVQDTIYFGNVLGLFVTKFCKFTSFRKKWPRGDFLVLLKIAKQCFLVVLGDKFRWLDQVYLS